MAFSSAKKARTLAGTLVIEVHSFDCASVTSGTIKTGMSQVLAAIPHNHTTEGDGKAVPGPDGDVDLSGYTSNDVGTVMVIGY